MIYRREDYIEQMEDNEKFPVKQIEVLQPVGDGEPKFIGQLTMGLQTPMGVQQMPISFEIDAKDIAEAFTKFEETAEPRIEEARKGIEEEIRRMRDEASSRIVRPGEMAPPGRGGVIDFGKLKQ